MQTIVLNDSINIRYEIYHPDKKPTIVMIHGFTGNHEGFQYIEPLLEDYRLIIPDLPGFGQSDLPDRKNWSVDAIARLLNEFVSKLHLDEPPHLMGHSMGGLVASSMLAQAPPDLYHQKAALLSPVPTPIRRFDSRWIGAVLGTLQYKVGHRTGKLGEFIVKSKLISLVLTQLMMTTRDRKFQKTIRRHHLDNLEHISSIEFYAELYADINRRGAINYAEALKRYRLLLMTGDADTVTPLHEQQKLIAAVQPERIEVLQGVNHLAHYERAEEVAAAMKTFFVSE